MLGKKLNPLIVFKGTPYGEKEKKLIEEFKEQPVTIACTNTSYNKETSMCAWFEEI